jgi:hypothetical protein
VSVRLKKEGVVVREKGMKRVETVEPMEEVM